MTENLPSDIVLPENKEKRLYVVLDGVTESGHTEWLTYEQVIKYREDNAMVILLK